MSARRAALVLTAALAVSAALPAAAGHAQSAPTVTGPATAARGSTVTVTTRGTPGAAGELYVTPQGGAAAVRDRFTLATDGTHATALAADVDLTYHAVVAGRTSNTVTTHASGTTLDALPAAARRLDVLHLTGLGDPAGAVQVDAHREGDPPGVFTHLADVRPAADGRYRADVVADADLRLYTRSAGEAASPTATVVVTPSIAGPLSADTGEVVPLTGNAPPGAAVTVVLFRRADDGTTVRRVLRTRAAADGRFRVTSRMDASYRYYALTGGTRSATQTTTVRAPVTGGPGWQPTPPLTATFFYPWYGTPSVDGSWVHWNDNGHSPPGNWFSNYLPDPLPDVFDPSRELYSSDDLATLYWQLSQLALARQQVAVASWLRPGDQADKAFRFIVTDAMNRPDNPYPNLRWAVYYEEEGYSDPSVDQLVSDLTYIAQNYANQPSYLHIDGKPVVFVYNAAHPGSDPRNDVARWEQARAATGFYVDMKADPLYAGVPASAMDAWHQYAPADRGTVQPGLFGFASPGFWKDGEAPRLPRDPLAFDAMVQQTAVSGVPWLLTETWNEWHEGTSVEPGTPVAQTTTGQAAADPTAPAFGERYVDVLNHDLPPLPAGTGAAGGG